MNWTAYAGFIPLVGFLLMPVAVQVLHWTFMRPCRRCRGTGRYARERDGHCFDWRCECFGGYDFRWFGD
jgi:hypothetical protein